MRFHNVDIQDELIDYIIEGNLVLFLGAGISKGDASNLPGFKTLAEEIGKGIFEYNPKEHGTQIDRYFGLLESIIGKKALRQKVIERMSQGTHSQFHKDLLSLFKSEKEIRVVTTNYDRFLSTASSDLKYSNFDTYYSPAIPLGRDFTGIVYLHGSVDRRIEDLILTDYDFGKAYLTDGWASRFLKEMFEKYSVLFIGYSHDDLIMQYFSRGLDPEKIKRYALVPEGKQEDWEFLGITPIPYPRDEEGGHKELRLAISKWANNMQMGALDREQEIKKILEAPRIYNLETDSHITKSLHDLDTVNIFIRYAKSIDWLKFAEENGTFRNLFSPCGNVGDIDRRFGWWFSKEIIPNFPEEAVALARRQGGKVHPEMFRFISHGLVDYEGRDPLIFSEWVNIFLNSMMPDMPSEDMGLLFNSCKLPQERIQCLLLFEAMIKPIFIRELFSANIGESEQEWSHSYAKFKLVGNDYFLKEAYDKIIKPNLESLTPELTVILTNNMTYSHNLLSTGSNVNEYRDLISHSRSAIEPDEQDQFDDEYDVVIDATRDLIEFYLEANPSKAHEIINNWAELPPPLLKRIAIHGISESTLSPDEKLLWLLPKDWLYKLGLKHEVFRLIKIAYPNSNDFIRKSLLEEVKKGIKESSDDKYDREISDFEVYNLMNWILQSAPDCIMVKKEVDTILKEHPDFTPRERPDLDHWISSGYRVSTSINIESFLERSYDELIDAFISETDEADEKDYIAMLAKDHFEWFWGLINRLVERNIWTPLIWRRIFLGWRERNYSFNEAEWNEVLNLIIKHNELYEIDYYIADLLEKGIRQEKNSIPLDLYKTAEEIAISLFDHLTQKEDSINEPPLNKDWATTSINYSGGMLTLFLLHLLSNENNALEKDKRTLPENYILYFDKILSNKSFSAQLGRVILVGQISYLDFLNPGWTRKNLLPLLNWSNEPRTVQQAWHGYLAWGKWTPSLLEELLPLFRKSFPKLSGDLESVRRRFCEHLAGIVLYGEQNPLDNGILDDFIINACLEAKKDLAGMIYRDLQHMQPNAIKELWNKWLHNYLIRRNNNQPLHWDEEEIKVIVTWIFHLEPIFKEVIEIICAMDKIVCDDHFFFSLQEKNYHETHPDELTNLLICILEKRKQPLGWFVRFIEEVVEKLVDTEVEKAKLLVICEKLAQHGSNKALSLRDRINES